MPLLQDITLGQHVPTGSVVHALDPRTKLLSILVLMVLVLLAKGFLLYAFAAAFLAVVIRVSRLPWGLVLRNLRPFSWLIGLTILVHLFFTPGQPIPGFPIAGIAATREGLRQGLFFGSRLALLIVTAALLTLTTAPIELTDALERLLKPLKRFGFPAHELAMMMVIALRFIPILMEEADRLRKAQWARGASFSGGIVRKVKSLIPLLVPLFLSAFRKADQLAIAMESRCYRGGEGRTTFRPLAFRARDGCAAAILLATSAFGLTLQWLR